VRTHYDNLKVSRDAPIEVIRAAFKSLAAKYHPDVNSGSKDASRIMRIINTSYAVLSDPTKRAEHDRWIARVEEVNDNPSKDQQRPQAPRHWDTEDGPIPGFQQIDKERRLEGWFAIPAIGLLVTTFVAGLFLIVRDGSRTIRPASPANVAPAIPPPPPGYDRDQPPQPMAKTIPSFDDFVKTLPPSRAKTATVPPVQEPPRSEIDDVIQSGKYSRMPRSDLVSPATGSGPSHLSVINQTGYALTVTFYSSTERSVDITAGQSLEMDLMPGTYRVLGRANSPTVLPFVGNDNYAAGAQYKSTFYIIRQIVP